MKVWAQSELYDIFKDTKPKIGGSYSLHMAKNEGESFQIGIHANDVDLKNVSIKLISIDGNLKCNINIIDYVFFSAGSFRASNKILRTSGPGELPEIITNKNIVDIPKGTSRSAIITVWSDLNTRPGKYKAEFSIEGNGGDDTIIADITVYDVVIPCPENSEYGYINWHNTHTKIFPDYYGVEMFSDAFWEINKKIAKQLYIERQNWLICLITDFIKVNIDENGGYSFDFENFDKYLQIYIDYQKPVRIAGGHLLRQDWGLKNAHFGRLMAYMFEKNNEGKVVKVFKPASLPECKKFHRILLTALAGHLREKGWSHLWAQHVADEINTNIQYEQCLYYYDLVKECFPEALTIDAVSKRQIETNLGDGATV